MRAGFIKSPYRFLLVLLIAIPTALAFQNFKSFESAKEGESVEVEGEIEVIIEDHPNSGHIRHYLKTKKNERFELLLSRPDNRLQTGAKVKLRGIKQKTYLALDLPNVTSAPSKKKTP